MGHHKPDKIHPYCLNCHYPISEFDHNCSQCGQKPTDGKTTLHDLWHEFIHTKLHLDGKFFTTLRHIFVPGKLTEEFFKGHHKRYAHPVQLFLVLGGIALIVLNKLVHETEEKMAAQFESIKKRTQTGELLFIMDSTARALNAYRDPNVRQAFDSLFVAQRLRTDLNAEPSVLRKTKESLLGIKVQNLRLEKLKEIRTNQPDSQAIVERAIDFHTKLLKLNQRDSAYYVRDLVYLKSKHVDSIALMAERIKPKYQEAPYQKVGIVRFQWGDDDDHDLTTEPLEHIFASVDETRNFDELQNGNYTKSLMRDSMALVSWGKKKVSVATIDIFQLSPEEIKEKYEIKGFWLKLLATQAIKTLNTGSSLLHSAIKYFYYTTIFSILPLGAVMLFFYRRQKRLYVEHVVFLMHYNCFLFIIFPVLLLEDYQLIWLIVTLIAFILGLKRYYGQKWGKTILKGALILGISFFISIFLLIFGFLLSFVLL